MEAVASDSVELAVCSPRLPFEVADGASPVSRAGAGRVLATDDPDQVAADAAAEREALARAADDAARTVQDTAVIAAAMTRIAGRTSTATRWPTTDRRTVLSGLDLAIDGLGVARAAVLVAERDSGDWAGRGDPTFEAWRGRTSKLGRRIATSQARQADELDVVPDVAAAVTTGRISLEHAKIIAKIAATGSPVQREAAQSTAGQEDLLDLATRVDADTFKTSTDLWAGHIDPATLERDHQAQRAARFLHLSETRNGTHLKGLLDAVTGRKVALALEAVTPTPAADDDREPEQRRADALGILADHVLTDPDTKPGAHVPPQITFILTEESFAGSQAHRDHQRATAAATAGVRAAGAAGASAGEDAPSVPTTIVGYEPATWEDGTPVPLSELGVAMCECELTRVVIDAAGEPLDVGRTKRLFTGAQRRAVIARDRECAWPGCHTPARWAQVHHLDWWKRDLGRTSVTRACLLCTFHHHEVHRRDLTLTRHTINEPVNGNDEGTTRPRGTMARVWYEFHEPSGRTIGSPPIGASPADDLDFTRVINPITGMSQPAFMLT